MKTNQEYKNASLSLLRDNWAQAVLATAGYFLIVYIAVGCNTLGTLRPAFAIAGSSIFSAAYLFLINPLAVGYYNALKDFKRLGDCELARNTFRQTFNGYLHNVWGMFIYYLFVLLWCLLLFVPGLIMSFAYSLTPFILKDNPELSGTQAVALSRKMMKGHKFDLFYLVLSFIGWIILACFTMGIGFLWLMPYMYLSVAEFYEDVKMEYALKNPTIS